MKYANALRIAAVLFALGAGAGAATETPWNLAKEAEGIRIFTRPVANSPLKEFRGEIELAVSPDKVVEVLRDANAFRKWMPDVVESKLLASTPNDQYHYLENATPWPVSHRDGVYHFTYSKGKGSNPDAVVVKVEAAPQYVPAKDGKVRIPKSDGYWFIEPTGTTTKVTYQIHADPGGSIPNWMANATVVDTPLKTLKSLRTYLQAKGR